MSTCCAVVTPSVQSMVHFQDRIIFLDDSAWGERFALHQETLMVYFAFVKLKLTTCTEQKRTTRGEVERRDSCSLHAVTSSVIYYSAHTHTHKCNIFVLYNKNSNGLLKDFEPNPHCIARVPVTEILDPARRLILGHHYCSPLFQQVVPGRCSRNQVSVLDLPVWYAFKTSLTAGSFTSGLMQRLEQQRCKMFLLPLTFSDNTADTSGRTLLANESVSYSCENKRCKY